MKTFALVFTFALLLVAQAQALPPPMYVCHSPANVDAAWDVKVFAEQGGQYVAMLSNPVIGPVIPKPRGAPINVQQRQVPSPGAILFQGRNFTLAMNRNQKRTQIGWTGEKIEGFAGQINGTLPDSGNTRATFNGVNVLCREIVALATGGGRGGSAR